MMKAEEIILIQRVVYSLLLLFLFLCMNHAIVFDNLSKLLFMVSGPKKEVMLKQFVSAWSLLGILGQALRYEVLECR